MKKTMWMLLRRTGRPAVLCAALALTVLPNAHAADPVPIELTVQGGKVAGGARNFRIKRDDPVVIVLRSDRADELHVHGYNLHADVAPNQPATLKFVAGRTGRFSMELHKSGVELGFLEIYPK